MIFDMTKRSGGGTSDVITGTSVSAGSYMVIPKVAGKNNYFAYVDADSNYFGKIGRALFGWHIGWIASHDSTPDTYSYSMKSGNTNVPPSVYSGGRHIAAFSEVTSDSYKLKFPNANTAGALPDGVTIKYLIW